MFIDKMKKIMIFFVLFVVNSLFAVERFAIFSPVLGMREDVPSITIAQALGAVTCVCLALLAYGELN